MRMIFSTVFGPQDPALTVGSLAISATGRPPIVAMPVTTPSAPKPSCSQLASRASSTKLSASTRRATRSRTGSLPCSCDLSRWRCGPPPRARSSACSRSDMAPLNLLSGSAQQRARGQRRAAHHEQAEPDARLGADDRRDDFAGGSLAWGMASHEQRPSWWDRRFLRAGRAIASGFGSSLGRMSLVLTEDRGAVRHLVLNRPEKRNALNAELIRELGAAIEAAAADADVRVLVVRGEGAMFSSGMDLNDLRDLSQDASGLRTFRRP